MRNDLHYACTSLSPRLLAYPHARASHAHMQVLTEALPGLITSLSFRKSMKWGAGDVTFSRPVRWLLALLGDAELPFVWGNLQAGRTTRLLRNAEQPEAQVRAR